MPVGAVGGSASGEGARRQGEGTGARGVVEGDGGSGEVNLISDVMPDVWIKGGSPLASSTDEPLQTSVGLPRLAADPAVLHLSEVALEEVDLVLVVDAGRVRGGALHREMVPDFARVDGGGGLRDELGAPHVAVP